MNEYLQYSQNIIVTVNDTDFNGLVKPSAILGYFQDVATTHAAIIGVGYDEMVAKNLAWVLIRTSYKVVRSPMLGEQLTVTTFPEKPRISDVNRSYYIYDSAGELVISGASKWCAIDLTAHKLNRCAPLFAHFDNSAFIPTQPFDDVNPKLPAISDYGVTIDEPTAFTVQVTDLDRYHHMNNAKYGDAVLNICGLAMLKSRSIARFDANYISQLFVGDKYSSYKVTIGNTTHIEIKKSSTNDVAFRARIEWHAKQVIK